MFKKILVSVIFATAVVSSFAQAADQQTEQAKKSFEEHLIKPCAGKKSGDQVQVTTPRGATVMATCKMTAVINIK
ncbi:hypothetical protein [Yersinia aldovae]|uniref:Periplasmic protein n=1 Tax=Yersinia aldovae TaxID=29483 RepID=A0A0T9TL97_YERAL|nr:hypothetical protein [Yersinia aldovae]AJJ65114.1 hypothetical protein AT01_1942 [Yersinia aldovae 670-83]EEP95236.1 hypothetical protein yaldo0001_3590 [Yersinia aldovae ATCC 35236]CNH99636.1 Uncharacterised protein [Yersinia aldovae]CNJ78265.1 Uncharacterised protein [Yersinia aldovae]CNK88044.1 Uncharacterised protein [Yersinia aldovae]